MANEPLNDGRMRRTRRHAERLEAKLPGPVPRCLAWLRQPSSRWFRIPFGTLLIIFGFLGFLPVLGFWMIPLGLFLIAEDFPPLQRLLRRISVSIETWWRRRRRSKAAVNSCDE